MRLRVHFQGATEPADIRPEPGHTLAQAIWLSGAPPPPLCAGLGTCGRCRVRYISTPPAPLPAETARLSPQDIADGWRLACRHSADAGADAGAEIFVPAPALKKRTAVAEKTGADAAAGEALLLAMDLGTTSLQWQAVTDSGVVIAEGQEINPQMGAGAEVMSRLAYAQRPGGLARLAGLTQNALRRIVDALPAPVAEICLAANTAVTAITLGHDIRTLAVAPYSVPLPGSARVSMPGLPPMYIPPQPAPFVGGDVSAGVAWLTHAQAPEYPFIFADMGTNGECVLALDPEHSLLASVPLGPALEGVGLACGGMAGADTPGAVTSFTLGPQGLTPVTLAGAAPTHICAVGYLSLLHVLRTSGLLDAEGAFCTQPPLPLARRIAANLSATEQGARLNVPGGLYCTARDVEEFLKVKAAFAWAVASLLEAAGLHPQDMRAFYVAGALGAHANVDDLRALGFVPPGVPVHTLGNTSLYGARHLLLQPQARAPLARWSGATTLLDLTSQTDYMSQYLRYMRLGYV